MMSSERATIGKGLETEACWLKRRNVELENSNQLLLGALAERIRAESSLRAMAVGFQWLMASKVFGIMLARTDGMLIDANDTFLRTFGYSREELRAGEICWRYICNSEEAFGKSWESGSCVAAEFQFVRKDGEKMRLLFAGEWEAGRQQIIGFTVALPT